ncbi:MAG: nitrite reductase (NAD(P)H), partial [Acidobacteria bacterium]|nr:nitrite reductase (NAD(P)H) [Acidobacteriota bacterium]
TADGWNLYVGGNGGATPAHAELLAKDLDDDTLVRYIGRYLMYYIRTADRLQRTARWQEELDGGLAHVVDVVVNDPERLRRFRSFVNVPSTPDDSITFVPERGQIRPATSTEKQLVNLGNTITFRTQL